MIELPVKSPRLNLKLIQSAIVLIKCTSIYRIVSLSYADLRRMINNHIWGPEFNKKEAEIRKLKAELARIDAEKTCPTLFTQTQSIPVPPPAFETYSPFYTPPRPQ